MIELIENPVGLDKAIQDLQIHLKNKISWLEVAYGKATRNTENKISYPEVFTNDGTDYKKIAPDDNVQAQVFFKVEDPGRVIGEFLPYQNNNFKYRISIIFWFDLSKIYPEKKYRYNEELKKDIVESLSTFPDFKLEYVYETAAQIWRDYTIGNMESRGLRQPFGGYRFEGNLQFIESCIPGAVTPNPVLPKETRIYTLTDDIHNYILLTNDTVI